MEINNFADLVKNYKVIVPIIQRDYVQGMESDIGIKSNRDNFITKIFRHLKDNSSLDLQYIYGILKNSNSVDDKIFMPIDGQQRLTTIYLLGWVCSVKEGRFKDFIDNTKGFSYQVRTSSSDFFKELRNEAYLDDFKNLVSGKEQIYDSVWYKRNWRPDNTVNNAVGLIMAAIRIYDRMQMTGLLDSLLGLNGKACVLICNVIFQNVADNTDKVESVEDLYETENRGAVTYINMNGRGKPLTEFESLKSKLHRYCRKNGHKNFAEEYDENYIHVLVELLDKKIKQKKDLSIRTSDIDGYVRELDVLTENLLVQMFFDLRDAQNAQDGSALTSSYGMAARNYVALRDELDRESPKMPNEYFDFIDYIIVNSCTQPNDEWLWAYISYEGSAQKRRWDLFYNFYTAYKKINKDEWDSFFKRTQLYTAGPDGNIGDNSFKIIYNLANIVADNYNGSVFDYLRDKDVEDINKVLVNRVNKATIKQEKICAHFEKIDKAKYDKLIGYENSLMHLFYISGLWDESFDRMNDINYINNINTKWGYLCKYMEYSKLYYGTDRDNEFRWKKLYYLLNLKYDANTGEYDIPAKLVNTVWNKELLIWEDVDPTMEKKSVLNIVKKAFELITDKCSRNNSTDYVTELNNYLVNIKNKQTKDKWLYYVLHYDFDELLKNCTEKNSNGYVYYDYDYDWNFFLYVVEKLKKLTPCRYGKIAIESSESTISRVDKAAGYANNKNLRIRLNCNVDVLNGNRVNSEIMSDWNKIYGYSVSSVSPNQVIINEYVDSTTRSNVMTDLEALKTNVVNYLESMKVSDMKSLQALTYSSEGYSDYDNAKSKLVSYLKSIINNNSNYKYIINSIVKSYSTITIDVVIVDDQNKPYSPFFSSGTSTQITI